MGTWAQVSGETAFVGEQCRLRIRVSVEDIADDALARELAMDALLMAVWRRKPAGRVVVHSDQGSQYGSDDFKRFCQAHNLEPSMSRRANFWDNAVAESFFSSLKKERIPKRSYKTRDLARADIFEYKEVFTTEPVATAISAASVPRRSKAPRHEVGKSLPNRGQSSHLSGGLLNPTRSTHLLN